MKLRHGEYLALGKIEAALKTSKYLTNICVFANSNELSCVAVAVAVLSLVCCDEYRVYTVLFVVFC